MTSIATRHAAVAGMFYPDDPGELRALIAEQLGEPVADAGAPPKAFVVPHAGYVYSGPIAASAYRLIALARGRIRRVVLMGPAHHVSIRGLALSGASEFATPLGVVPVDHESEATLRGLPQVVVSRAAHALEHSLEVQLPFLQEALADFSLVALLVGDATGEEVAEVLEAVWGGPETLILISSDLSHYLSYDEARGVDEATARAIVELRANELDVGSACGRVAIRGLLEVVRRRGMQARAIDLRNSGDTAGSRDAVVGYGSFAFS